MTDAYPSLPLRDAVELNQRALAGDAEARAFFDGLFQPEAECFTCADPVGAHVVAQIIGDPVHKSAALIVPICGAKCGALPHLYLRHRVTKVAKAVWPKAGWWKATFVPRGKPEAGWPRRGGG